MLLTIMRHGEAGHAASDRERQLTGRGLQEVPAGCRALRESLQRRGLSPVSRLLYSAWVRTTQTAQIAREALAPDVFETCDAILPGARVAPVDRVLEALLETEAHVLLVSHQPLVSSLASHYLGHQRVPGLSPGAWVCLELHAAAAHCGELRCWALPPQFEVQA